MILVPFLTMSPRAKGLPVSALSWRMYSPPSSAVIVTAIEALTVPVAVTNSSIGPRTISSTDTGTETSTSALSSPPPHEANANSTTDNSMILFTSYSSSFSAVDSVITGWSFSKSHSDLIFRSRSWSL